jgi:hypothetical protein
VPTGGLVNLNKSRGALTALNVLNLGIKVGELVPGPEKYMRLVKGGVGICFQQLNNVPLPD